MSYWDVRSICYIDMLDQDVILRCQIDMLCWHVRPMVRDPHLARDPSHFIARDHLIDGGTPYYERGLPNNDRLLTFHLPEPSSWQSKTITETFHITSEGPCFIGQGPPADNQRIYQWWGPFTWRSGSHSNGEDPTHNYQKPTAYFFVAYQGAP